MMLAAYYFYLKLTGLLKAFIAMILIYIVGALLFIFILIYYGIEFNSLMLDNGYELMPVHYQVDQFAIKDPDGRVIMADGAERLMYTNNAVYGEASGAPYAENNDYYYFFHEKGMDKPLIFVAKFELVNYTKARDDIPDYDDGETAYFRHLRAGCRSFLRCRVQ
jgi:hypothetical protein